MSRCSVPAQVICRGNTYLHAIQKMQRALYEFHIRGVKTNILFLENVLRHPEFLSGTATTSFIDRCTLVSWITCLCSRMIAQISH